MATVIISSVGIQGAVGPQGPSGSQGPQGPYPPTGSFATTGSNVFIGNQIVTGSLFTTGSNTLIGNTTLNGSINVSGSQIFTGTATNIGTVVQTGSFLVSGSTTQTGNNTLIGNTVLSGSIEVSGSSVFHNSIFTVTGSSNFVGDATINGNLNVISGSAFYRWGNKLFNYGAFSDTTSQSGSANTAYPITYNTTDVVGSGINVVSQSRITVDNTGIYNLQFSAQMDRVAGSGTAIVSIWLRITGSDVANSCTDVTLSGNAGNSAHVASWNFVFPMSASQYCELVWSTPDSNIQIVSRPTRTNPIRPAVPSIIATLSQIA